MFSLLGSEMPSAALAVDDCRVTLPGQLVVASRYAAHVHRRDLRARRRRRISRLASASSNDASISWVRDHRGLEHDETTRAPGRAGHAGGERAVVRARRPPRPPARWRPARRARRGRAPPARRPPGPRRHRHAPRASATRTPHRSARQLAPRGRASGPRPPRDRRSVIVARCHSSNVSAVATGTHNVPSIARV